MDHPVIGSNLEKEFWNKRAIRREQRFDEKHAATTFENDELPRAYIALIFGNLKRKDYDVAAYCIPIGLIKEAAEKAMPTLDKPTAPLPSPPPAVPVAPDAGELHAEVRLAKARATVAGAEVDIKVLSGRLKALAK